MTDMERELPVSETATIEASEKQDVSTIEKQVVVSPPTIPDGGAVAWTTVCAIPLLMYFCHLTEMFPRSPEREFN